MCQAVDQLNVAWSAEQLPTMRLRIGIASGTVVAGAYGSADRLKYTTIGPPVNLAARLESHEREQFVAEGSGHRVLVAEATAALVADTAELEYYGVVSVRGFAEAVSAYRLPLINEEERTYETNAHTDVYQPMS